MQFHIVLALAATALSAPIDVSISKRTDTICLTPQGIEGILIANVCHPCVNADGSQGTIEGGVCIPSNLKRAS